MTILVVDIGGTNLKFGFSVEGVPRDEVRLFPSALLREGDCVATLAAISREVISLSGLTPQAIVSTVPGFIDTDRDLVLFAANLPALNGRRLATEWSEKVGIPVFLERDAVLLLMGESVAGVSRGEDSVLGIFFGTGVGAAYLEDGKPFRGAGWALEIGHMPFGNGKEKWDSSRPDCLEAYVSGRALEIIAAKHGIATESIFAATENNASLAHDIDTFVEDQAAAVVTGIAMFSPRIVLLGGGLCEMKAYPKDRLVTRIQQKSGFAHAMCRAQIRWAALGWKSVLYGGLLVATERQELR